MFRSIAAAALALAALSSTADATTFYSRAAFEAATTGITNHVTPAVGFSSSIAFGGMTFTQSGAGGTFTTQGAYTPLIPNELAINGPEDFTVTFTAPVYGFGMDLVQASANPVPGPCGPDVTCFLAAFTLASPPPTGPSAFAAPIGATSFIGFTFDAGITSISFTDMNGRLENEYFGNFVTASASAVPVPAAGLLLLGGVAMLGALRRRG